MRGDEREALSILEKLGFKCNGKPKQTPEVGGMNYDFEVEKNGITYTVEVKTTQVGKRSTVPWEELREMGWQFGVHGKSGLLIFVDCASDEYCIFEMSYIKIGLVEKGEWKY
jgi:hypothetical protein